MLSTRKIIRSLKTEFRCFIKGVSNLYRWFSTIWWDRDWDYAYLDTIILTKLDRMAKSFENDPQHTGSEFNARRIRTAHKLLTLVSESFYYTEYTKYYEQDFNLTEDGILEWINPASDDLGKFFDKYPRIYKKAVKLLPANQYLSGDVETRLRIAIEMSNINQARARRLVFNIISTYSPDWWE